MRTPKEEADRLLKKHGRDRALDFLSDLMDDATGTKFMYWREVEKIISEITYCKDCGNKIYSEPETGLCRNCRNGIEIKQDYNDEDKFPLPPNHKALS
jgi:predicted amidophosphoribosyltransferase